MVSAKDNLTPEEEEETNGVGAKIGLAHRGVARSNRLYEEAQARRKHQKELLEAQLREQAAKGFRPQRAAKNSRWEKTQYKKDREFLEKKVGNGELSKDALTMKGPGAGISSSESADAMSSSEMRETSKERQL